MSHQFVVKRSGLVEPLKLDKITNRIRKLCYGLNDEIIDPVKITMQVIAKIYPGIKTEQIDVFSADIAACMAFKHQDFMTLASRIAVDNIHKKIDSRFSVVIKNLYKCGLATREFFELTDKHAVILNETIDHQADFLIPYAGLKALEKEILINYDNSIMERPQHMFLRVALTIHTEDIKEVQKTYHLLSQQYYTHASSVMRYAGTDKSQLFSYFTTNVADDSVEAIYETLKNCAILSRQNTKTGLSFHSVRANNTDVVKPVKNLVATLQVFSDMMKHVNLQQANAESCAGAYIEPWHADIFEYLNLSADQGSNMHYAIWCPDLFFQRAENDSFWSLMCPSKCPNLNTNYGQNFEDLYKFYEKQNMFVKQVKALDLLYKICETQIKTGGPSILFKDTCNMKSNQKNAGVIQGGGFCADIIEYNSAKETSACSLASIAVNKFVCSKVMFDMTYNEYKTQYYYNYTKLHETTKSVVKNINKIIDFHSFLPNKLFNNKNKSMALGIHGLADTFAIMQLPYDSESARKLNKHVAETIYHAALEASCELAAIDNPYESYNESPASLGMLQYDMHNIQPSTLWNWSALKKIITQFGLRNSQLIAYLPASTCAKHIGCNTSFEPFMSNINTLQTSTGCVQYLNEHLVKVLIDLNLYNLEVIYKIYNSGGSVQNLQELPDSIKSVYKTVWELDNKIMVDMAADRAPFICHSQSLDLFMSNASVFELINIHQYSWKKGLKTSMYHLHRKPDTSHNNQTCLINKNSYDDTVSTPYCAIGCFNCAH